MKNISNNYFYAHIPDSFDFFNKIGRIIITLNFPSPLLCLMFLFISLIIISFIVISCYLVRIDLRLGNILRKWASLQEL